MEDISNEVNDSFYDEFKKGQVLGFKKDDVVTRYKIIRLDKKRKIAMIKPVTLYTSEEFNNKLKGES